VGRNKRRAQRFQESIVGVFLRNDYRTLYTPLSHGRMQAMILVLLSHVVQDMLGNV
jgi:hypothetical protein